MSLQHDELVSSAADAFSTGRLDQAQRLAQSAVDARPDDAEALLILGMVAERKNDLDTALAILGRVAELDPASFHARILISRILRANGLFEEALHWCREAVALEPSEPTAQFQLGSCLLSTHQWEEAVGSFQNAALRAPDVPAIHDNLGLALQYAGRNQEAIRAFSTAVALDPRQVSLLGRLGNALMSEAENARAAECARRMLELDPVSAPANVLLAAALVSDGHALEAAKYAKRAVKFAPDDASIVGRYASILQSLGQIEEAGRQYERSLELAPNQGFAYLGLVTNRKVVEADRPIVRRMEELVKFPQVAMDQLSELRYGLGKACEDLGEYQAAMDHFDEANRLVKQLKFGTVPFNYSRNELTYQFPIRNFDEQFIGKYRPLGSLEAMPIFVAGMIRTGTTLAEQILSSHPEIGAAGELPFWVENVRSALQEPGNVLDLPRLTALTDVYLTTLRRIAPGMQRVVDKMPTNFLHLGFLNAALPNARIIHMIRHPVDTSLSIWATPNRSRIDWANEKSSIVFTYRMYMQIAQHWRKVLPPDRYLEVHYEDLVSNQEQVTRQMIEFCGLDWNDACLRPQDNARSVATPSAWQVRQPVYKTSTERWRKYEPWLGEFAELLAL